MRGLIRPTLFLVARLGLSTAVILAIAGRHWRLFLRVEPISRQTVSFELGRNAIEFCHLPGLSVTNGYMVIVDGPESKLHAERAYESNGAGHNDIARIIAPIPGVIILTNIQQVSEVAIKHWLIITVFALFYAVLKWVYRERRGIQSVPISNRRGA